VQPIQHEEKVFDIHPYVLGALIGDGALTQTRIAISTPDMDIEVIENVRHLLKDFQMRENRHPTCPQYLISQGSKKYGKAFYHKIAELGLNVKSPERFIPAGYFLGSVKQRYDLLRGLMDTDGSCKKNRNTFHTLSVRLAEDVAQLVRSLGGWAKVRTYDRSESGKGIEYQVNIRTLECPFYLERKAAGWKFAPNWMRLSILSIEPDGIAMQRCIRIADARSLYVTAGYTLTHNTPMSIAFCNEKEAHRVLVIVPASVRIQWGERIREWSTIPNVKVSVMLKVKDGIHPTAHYQIISYNAATNPNIIRAISKYEWDVLICDEIHALKSVDAIRTRAIFGNSRGEFQHGDVKMPAISKHCRMHLGLTGTPLLNRPSEVYTLIRHFDHEAIDYLGWEAFKERYNRQADMKTIQGKRFKLENTSLETELQNRLRISFMTRHEKKDVLTHMKPPRYSIVRVEENGTVRGALDAEGMLGLSVDEIQTTKDFEILGHIAEARRLMGIAIAPQIVEYASDFLEGSDEKLAIFGWHLDVLTLLENGLSRFGTVRVDGGKSANARQKAVDDFINQDDIRVFIGNIQAAGTGLDGLQKICSRCYLAEPDWVPAQNEQAVSRLDRIGQENIVSAEIFVAPGSISEKILVKALEKMNVIHRVLDAKEGEEN
jgi:superfamily II DNA or RNA helicase